MYTQIKTFDLVDFNKVKAIGEELGSFYLQVYLILNVFDLDSSCFLPVLKFKEVF